MKDPIIVTGATGNLGGAVVSVLLAAGYPVISVDRGPLKGDIPSGLSSLMVDLGNRPAAVAALGQIPRAAGLVCLVGGFRMGTPVWDVDPSTLDGMGPVNVGTLLNAIAGAMPALRAGDNAAIVTIGAGAGLPGEGGAGMGAYAASKAAVIKLTQCLAADLDGSTITANTVLPSIIDTPANRSAMPEADTSTWVAPADIAQVIAFLLSPNARSISGSAIPVSRGTANLPPPAQ